MSKTYMPINSVTDRISDELKQLDIEADIHQDDSQAEATRFIALQEVGNRTKGVCVEVNRESVKGLRYLTAAKDIAHELKAKLEGIGQHGAYQ